MKIFGSLSCYLSYPDKVLGATVASTSFFHALIKYSSFDQIHLFYGNLLEKNFFMEQYAQYINLIGKRIFLFPRYDLIKQLTSFNYHVFHQPNLEISDLIDIRNTYISKFFPITGITHSISYHRFYKEFLFLEMLPYQNCDGIVCTTESAKKTLLAYINSAKNVLEKKGGIKNLNSLKLDVIPLGIEETLNKSLNLSKKDLGLKDLFTVLIFGRIDQQTKYDLFPLLLHLKERSFDYKGIQFVIAGNAVESNAILAVQNFIKDNALTNVYLFFNVDKKTKQALFQTSNCFLSPADNIQETFGLTLVEAHKYNLPIIASDWNGYRENLYSDKDFTLPTGWLDKAISSASELIPIQYEQDYHFLLSQQTAVDFSNLPDYLNKLKYQAFSKTQEVADWSSIIKQYEGFWLELNKAIPEKQSSSNLNMNSLFFIDFSKAFSHYPTKSYDLLHLKVSLSGYGSSVLARKNSLPIYEELELLLDPVLIFYILERVKNHNSFLLNKLSKIIKSKFKKTETEINFIYSWMLKYNLLIAVV